MNYRDKLLLFNSKMLLNKREILDSFDDFVSYHGERRNEEGYSEGRRKILLSLCDDFRNALVQKEIPNLTKHWLYYEYEAAGDGIRLSLRKCEKVDFDEDGEILSMTSSEEYILIEVKCDYLTVEQYAALHKVTDTTVRQWIRRGKLRSATKKSRDWLIPALADKPTRGFQSVTYHWDLLPLEIIMEFPYLGGSQSVYIYQDDEDKKVFYGLTNSERIQLAAKERERLELALISATSVAVEDIFSAIQFVPAKRVSGLPILSRKKDDTVYLPFSDIIVRCYRNNYVYFSSDSAVGDLQYESYPEPYILPVYWELWGVLREHDKKLYDVFEHDDYSNCVQLGSVSGHLILCTQMILDGYNPCQVCDDKSGDLSHIMAVLCSEGEPLNELTGEPMQNVFYIDELLIDKELRGKGIGTRVLQELPYLMKNLTNIEPDILSYYLLSFSPKKENDQAVYNRIERFYRYNGFSETQDKQLLYAFTNL